MATGMVQKTLLAGRTAVRSPFRSNGCRVVAKAGNWLPGSTTPAYLDNLPGSFGFDPLGLGATPSILERYQEAELINGRYAMLGTAGCLAVEIFGFGDWYSAPQWAVTGGTATFFGIEAKGATLSNVLVLEFILVGGAEIQRALEPDAEKKKYPGGAFDPLGFAKDPAGFESAKLKEIKNGRLAMLSFIGYVAQHAATGKTPLQALGDHISSPWTANFATNGVSLPF